MTYAEDYYEQIKSGQEVTCEEVRTFYERE